MTFIPQTPEARVNAADAAVVTASLGWPAPDSPYAHLIEAERDATRLTYIGAIPGVLLDMQSVADRDAVAVNDPLQRLRGQRLLVARQELSTARLAVGQLELSLILGSDFLNTLRQNSPGRVEAQIEDLVDAIDAGWEIRIAPSGRLGIVLPPHTHSMVLAGEPLSPEGVYWGASHGAPGPHESWAAEGLPVQQAARIYAAIDYMTPTAADTRTLLQNQL